MSREGKPAIIRAVLWADNHSCCCSGPEMLLETLFAGAVACVEGNGKECASLPFLKEVGHESVVELPFECDRAERPALAR